MTVMNATTRLRMRVTANARNSGDERTSAFGVRLAGAKTRVRDARNKVKRFIRRFEQRW